MMQLTRSLSLFLISSSRQARAQRSVKADVMRVFIESVAQVCREIENTLSLACIEAQTAHNPHNHTLRRVRLNSRAFG